MPLFMFLSGIFAMKSFKDYDIIEVYTFLKKKTLRILWPFLTVGTIYCMLKNIKVTDIFCGYMGSYWFLPALFYAMFTEMIVGYLFNMAKTQSGILDILVHVFLGSGLFAIYYVGIGKDIPYYLHFIKMYPFFFLGVFYMRYSRLKDIISKSNCFFAFCVLGCCFLVFSIYTRYHLPLNLTGFFAIPILIQLSLSIDNKIPGYFTSIVKYSLEIYIFHWFFLPSMLGIGDWFVKHSNETIQLYNGNFILLFVLTFLVATPIIGVCIVISSIIHRSKILDVLFFGSLK